MPNTSILCIIMHSIEIMPHSPVHSPLATLVMPDVRLCTEKIRPGEPRVRAMMAALGRIGRRLTPPPLLATTVRTMASAPRMARIGDLKSYKPTTPSRRHRVVIDKARCDATRRPRSGLDCDIVHIDPLGVQISSCAQQSAHLFAPRRLCSLD